jgi:peroxiredoxin
MGKRQPEVAMADLYHQISIGSSSIILKAYPSTLCSECVRGSVALRDDGQKRTAEGGVQKRSLGGADGQ